MPRLQKYIQTPTERKRYNIDYSEWLDSGELLSTVVTDWDTPGMSVDGILIDTDKKTINLFVSGGNDGDTYELLITVTTTGGQTKEDSIVYAVRDL